MVHNVNVEKRFKRQSIKAVSYTHLDLYKRQDSSNVEDILMPCMYEDVYRISTGENLKTEGWKLSLIHILITETYWKIGKYIVEFEQDGNVKAAYGSKVLTTLSHQLTLRCV